VPVLALDASVLIAAHLEWHEHHQLALDALRREMRSADEVIVPVPALLEAYSVMTRMPRAFRVTPQDAFDLLQITLRENARLVSLEPEHGWAFLSDLAERALAGGKVYDAFLLACAVESGADRFLTLDRDFDELSHDGIAIVCPLPTNR
jgi:predicted nucleic acid-binding protein